MRIIVLSSKQLTCSTKHLTKVKGMIILKERFDWPPRAIN